VGNRIENVNCWKWMPLNLRTPKNPPYIFGWASRKAAATLANDT
jgi:hypothetical protein